MNQDSRREELNADYSNEELLVASAEEWRAAHDERHSRAIKLGVELRRAHKRIVELEAQVARLKPDDTSNSSEQAGQGDA